MPFDLKGAVAVVTGASRGVGRGVALGLCASGATVHITGRTEAEGHSKEAGLAGSLKRTADECNTSERCFPHVCDHLDDTQTKRVFQEILDRDHHIDILVNSVWGGYEAMVDERGRFTWMLPFWQQPMTRWDRMLAAGLRARYFAAQEAARHMVRQRSGSIVNVSSVASEVAMPGLAPYGMAKAGVNNLTRTMAADYGARGVRVNCVCVGFVRSDGFARAMTAIGRDPDEVAAESNAIGRVGTTDEVAYPILFLVSRAAGFISGEIVHLNGGPRVTGPW